MALKFGGSWLCICVCILSSLDLCGMRRFYILQAKEDTSEASEGFYLFRRSIFLLEGGYCFLK